MSSAVQDEVLGAVRVLQSRLGPSHSRILFREVHITPRIGPPLERTLEDLRLSGIPSEIERAFLKACEQLREAAFRNYDGLVGAFHSLEHLQGPPDIEVQHSLSESVTRRYNAEERLLVSLVEKNLGMHLAPRVTPGKFEVLEKAFTINAHPNRAEREALANHTSLHIKQFQNRRFRLSRRSSEGITTFKRRPTNFEPHSIPQGPSRQIRIEQRIFGRLSQSLSDNRNAGALDDTATLVPAARALDCGADANPTQATSTCDPITSNPGLPLSSFGAVKIIRLEDGSIAYRPSTQSPSSVFASSSLPSAVPSFGTSISTATSPDPNPALPPTPKDGISLSFAARQAAGQSDQQIHQQSADTAAKSNSANTGVAVNEAPAWAQETRAYQHVELGIGSSSTSSANASGYGNNNGGRAVKAMPKRKKTSSGSSSGIVPIVAGLTSRSSGQRVFTYKLDDFVVPQLPARIVANGASSDPVTVSVPVSTIDTSVPRTPSSGQLEIHATSSASASPSQLASTHIPSTQLPAASATQAVPANVFFSHTASPNPDFFINTAQPTKMSNVRVTSSTNERVPSLTRSCSTGSAMSTGGPGLIGTAGSRTVSGSSIDIGPVEMAQMAESDGQGLGMSQMLAMGNYADSPGAFDGPSCAAPAQNWFDPRPDYAGYPFSEPMDSACQQYSTPVFNFRPPTPAHHSTAFATSSQLAQSGRTSDISSECAYEFEQISFVDLPFSGGELDDAELREILLGGMGEMMPMERAEWSGMDDLPQDGTGHIEAIVQENQTEYSTAVEYVQPTPEGILNGIPGWNFEPHAEASSSENEIGPSLEEELRMLLASEGFEGLEQLLQTSGTSSAEPSTLPVGCDGLGTSTSQENISDDSIDQYLSYDISSFTSQAELAGTESQHQDAETIEISQLTFEQLQASGWMSEFDQAMPFPQEDWRMSFGEGCNGLSLSASQDIGGEVQSAVDERSGGMSGWSG